MRNGAECGAIAAAAHALMRGDLLPCSLPDHPGVCGWGGQTLTRPPSCPFPFRGLLRARPRPDPGGLHRAVAETQGVVA